MANFNDMEDLDITKGPHITFNEYSVSGDSRQTRGFLLKTNGIIQEWSETVDIKQKVIRDCGKNTRDAQRL